MERLRYMVIAVPDRAENVAYMARHIPDLEVVWDEDGLQRTTLMAAYKRVGDDPVLMFEDDVILTQQFCKKAEIAIRKRPDAVIQFFSRRKADLTIGSRWQTGSVYLMNQCFYQPAGIGKAVSEFLPHWFEEQFRLLDAEPKESKIAGSRGVGGCDMMMQHFYKAHGIRHWVHIPSLVEHAIGVSVINKRRSSRRQSKTFEHPELAGLPTSLKLEP